MVLFFCHYLRIIFPFCASGKAVLQDCGIIWVFSLIFLYMEYTFWWRSETYTKCTSNNTGPIVQSVVSLTSSLRVISLTVLVDSIYNILIFFAEKM